MMSDSDKSGGDVGGKYLDITNVGRGSIEKYYDNVAKDYSKAMDAWGYQVPQLMTEVLIEHGKVEPSSDYKVRHAVRRIVSRFTRMRNVPFFADR